MDTLTFLGLWLVFIAGVFLLHWDRRTMVGGAALVLVASIATVVAAVATDDLRPSLAAVGATLFFYGFGGISHERPQWLRRLLYISGLALFLFVSVYS